VINIWSILFFCILATLAYQAIKTRLAREGRDITQYISIPKWIDIPEEIRANAGYGTAIAAGLFGLALPDIMTRTGEWFVAIGVIGCVLVFWWGIPLAIYKLLNNPDLPNESRFPLIAFLVAFSVSLAAHIHVIALMYFVGMTVIGSWWWYEHHPYLKMKAAHTRCKELHDVTTVLSVDDFADAFEKRYAAKWGFPATSAIMRETCAMYVTDAVRKVPPLPELPPFQPAYRPGADITRQLAQLEITLREMPVKSEQLVRGITEVIDAYTAAVPPPSGASVFTVAVKDLVSDLPGLVHELGTTFPSGFTVRETFDGYRDEISKKILSEKEYAAGQRIDPEAYASA
jgi:hypothetical protein